jgi:hypothetical protein
MAGERFDPMVPGFCMIQTRDGCGSRLYALRLVTLRGDLTRIQRSSESQGAVRGCCDEGDKSDELTPHVGDPVTRARTEASLRTQAVRVWPICW